MASANVKMPLLFSDHMMLQRDQSIPVWGWADAGEEVTVQFGSQSAKATADAAGKWKVTLEPVAANAEPQALTVTGKNQLNFADVLVGDIWVCSGQSNIEFNLGGAHNAGTEVPQAKDLQLRMFKVAMRTSLNPEADVTVYGKQQWVACNPEYARNFSAVGYFYGRELRRDLKVPIGLIAAVQGGTRAQVWMSLESIAQNRDADPEFKEWLTKRHQVVAEYPQHPTAYGPAMEKYEKDVRRWWNEVENAPAFVAKKKAWEEENKKALEAGKPPLPRPQPSEPRPKEPESPDGGRYSSFMVGNLYNGMIAPMMPYAIKGVIWYQGEGNSDKAKQYRFLFPLLIKDWRAHWGQGDFPFLFVQLPNINKAPTEPVPAHDLWPGTREAQEVALTLPHTGMAVTIDVGDPYDVHGKDKIDVGQRLALVARHLVYGEKIVYTGPTYESMKVDGDKVRITFKNTGSGMEIGVPPWTPSGKIPPVAAELKGFAIAGADKKWVWAEARIVGDQVVVSSPKVTNPVAVRYGWADNPPCNLYNKEKLPAAPFRTDHWEP
ncbi:MAG: sialate O-acetylesterase [Phycisphaerae bacterium]